MQTEKRREGRQDLWVQKETLSRLINDRFTEILPAATLLLVARSALEKGKTAHSSRSMQRAAREGEREKMLFTRKSQ